MARFGRSYTKLGLVRPVQITGAVTTADNSDTEGITDSLSLVQTESQVPSDTEGLTDSVVLTQVENNTQADTEGITDSLTLSQTELFSKSDTEGLTDTVAFTTGIRIPGDTEGLTDSLSIFMGTSYTKTDPVGLTDSVTFTQVRDPNTPYYTGYDNSLVQGPGTIYLGAVGALEPSMGNVASAPDSAVWTALGGLLGGVELVVSQEWVTIDLKQLPDQPMRRLKKRQLSVKTQMAEATLLNLGYALNDTGAVASGAGWNQYVPSSRSEATALTYNALLIDGWAPGFRLSDRHQKHRRIVLRKVLSIDNVEFGYTKDGQTVYTVTWSCHYVDGSTAPFRIIDEA